MGARVAFSLLTAMLGAIAGSLVGIVLQPWIAAAAAPVANVGLAPPMTFDLKVFTLTFGASIRLNTAGVAGLLVGGWWGFRG